jgi:hypothetical protein
MFLMAGYILLSRVAVLVGFADPNRQEAVTGATGVDQWCWLSHNKYPVDVAILW